MKKAALEHYVRDEITSILERITSYKHKFDEYGEKIVIAKQSIGEFEKKIDTTYEAFSPISGKFDFYKAEIEDLEKKITEWKGKQDDLARGIKALEDKKSDLEGILYGTDESDREQQALFGIEVLEEQEAERQRIARDLHDTTVQNLAALIHKVEFCSQILELDPLRAKLELELVNRSIRESVNGMREIIYNLRPMTFDDMGFDDTLHRTVERMQKSMDTRLELTITGEYPLKSVVQLTVLRLIQEAVHNCRKHASAELCQIQVEYGTDQLLIQIADDGIGFDVASKECKRVNENNSGFGLSMMKERVKLLNGEISIDSGNAQGTCIQVKIPLGM